MSGKGAKSPQSTSFNAASGNGNIDTWMYWLLWNLVYNVADVKTKEDLKELADTFLPKAFKDNERVGSFLQGLEDFVTNLNSEDRNIRAGEFVERHATTLRVPDSVKIKPDPTLAAAMAEAKTLTANDLKGDPTKWSLAQKVAYAYEVAEKYGLNGTMLVMQIRQESGFRNSIGSPAGAMGIAQFTRDTGRMYGLITPEDFANPEKALDAMGRHMGYLTNRYRSQEVALAAYNGGEGAVRHVMKKLGKTEITADDLISYWGDRREKVGTATRSAWHVETYDYVTRITGNTLAASNATLAEHAATRTATAKTGLSGRFDDRVADVAAPVLTSQTVTTGTPPAPTTFGAS